jgi:hypothetical protein
VERPPGNRLSWVMPRFGFWNLIKTHAGEIRFHHCVALFLENFNNRPNFPGTVTKKGLDVHIQAL